MGTIHRLIEAKKAERQEQGKDAGFSLIELIIVVVILGILVAIAIPVFGAIQKAAQQSAVDTAAANGAASVAASIADQDSTTDPAGAVGKLSNTDITVSTTNTATSTVDSVCVKATPSAAWIAAGVTAKSAGPALKADGTCP